MPTMPPQQQTGQGAPPAGDWWSSQGLNYPPAPAPAAPAPAASYPTAPPAGAPPGGSWFTEPSTGQQMYQPPMPQSADGSARAQVMPHPIPGGNAPGGQPTGPGQPTQDYSQMDPSKMFLDAMQKSGLDPVAMQGHGQQIADAVNKAYPGLGVKVDPKSDAIMWPGVGSVDVTIDSGKGGWSFRPDGYYDANGNRGPGSSGGGWTGGSGQGAPGSVLSNPNDLTAGFTSSFQAPSAEQAAATPGYKFALGAGLQGIDRGAAAKGTLLTMGNMKDRADYATGLADQTYGHTYDRAMGEYMNAFNIFNSNQGNLFNRNFAISGQGLAAAGGAAGAATNIGNAGANAATNTGQAGAAGDIAKGNNNAAIATNLGQLGATMARSYLQ